MKLLCFLPVIGYVKIKKVVLKFLDFWAYLKQYMYDLFSRKNIVVSIGDLMTVRESIDGNQFLVASRLLDIEAYCKNGDDTFRYQEELSILVEYDKTFWSEKFRNIIESYLKCGYNNKSRLLLDKDAILRNGTHRTAMHLYLKIYESKALLVNRKWPYFDMSMQRYYSTLPQETYRLIMCKLDEIKLQLLYDGVSFCALIPKDMNPEKILAINGKKITRTIELLLPDNFIISLENRNFNCKGEMYVLVLFTLSQPEYKVSSHKLISNIILNSVVSHRTFIAYSCYEGKQIYDQLSPYFVKEDVVFK